MKQTLLLPLKPCGHATCPRCFLKWSKQSDKCPYCIQAVSHMSGIPPEFPEDILPESALKRHKSIIAKNPGKILMKYSWKMGKLKYFDPEKIDFTEWL